MKLNKVRTILHTILLIACVSCKPVRRRIYSMGEEQEFYGGTDLDGIVRLDAGEYTFNDDGETCDLGLTYIFYPLVTMSLDKQYVMVESLYSFITYYTDVDKNIEKNGFDIFEIKIEKEMKYIFYFTMPIHPLFEDLDKKESGWGTCCDMDDVTFYVNTKEIYESMQNNRQIETI
ncbi:MAG: hypothetical protein SPK64_01225 [Candidatus Enterosoma sp.]|nr:hypothetical protein [Candidatus Enterosoma sp.]